MSLTIHNSRFLEMRYLPTKERLYFRWKPETKSMEEADFKREMQMYLSAFKSHKVTAVCSDLRENNFVLNLALQTWLDQEVNIPAMQEGLKYKAFVMPSELTARLSIEQVSALSRARGLKTRNTATLIDAHQWLDSVFMSAVL